MINRNSNAQIPDEALAFAKPVLAAGRLFTTMLIKSDKQKKKTKKAKQSKY